MTFLTEYSKARTSRVKTLWYCMGTWVFFSASEALFVPGNGSYNRHLGAIDAIIWSLGICLFAEGVVMLRIIQRRRRESVGPEYPGTRAITQQTSAEVMVATTKSSGIEADPIMSRLRL